jgi:hypothetical protein
MRYTTTIYQSGNTTGVPVPEEVMTALGPAKRHLVVVTFNGHTYRSSAVSYEGQFMISLSAANRAAAGVAGGDTVEVDVVLDTEPRVVEVPPELAAALAQDPAARTFYETLSASKQKRFTLPVADAKTDETRTRRVEKAITALREGRLL